MYQPSLMVTHISFSFIRQMQFILLPTYKNVSNILNLM